MLTNFIAVAFGGALGSMLRYLITMFVSSRFHTAFPYGTLMVNLFGCLLIGVVSGYFLKHQEYPMYYMLFTVTGLLGGLTTFSTFSLETFKLLLAQPGLGILNMAGSILGGLVLIALGMRLA